MPLFSARISLPFRRIVLGEERAQVPDFDGSIAAGRSKVAPVRAKGYPVDGIGMAAQSC
jgi:hypothetical protein